LPNQPKAIKYNPALKGEHTKEILQQLGKPERVIEQLLNNGVVKQALVETKV
jgi:uncharacterized membrane protein